MIELVGWLSSGILFATLVTQIYKQWKQRSRKGVSRWLFIGQLAASLGFMTYSIGMGSTVFIVTNAFLSLAAIVGIVIYFASPKG